MEQKEKMLQTQKFFSTQKSNNSRIYLIFLLLLLVVTNACGQDNFYDDIVEVKDMKYGDLSFNDNISVSSLNEILGKPDDIDYSYDEDIGDEYKYYYYGLMVFSFYGISGNFEKTSCDFTYNISDNKKETKNDKKFTIKGKKVVLNINPKNSELFQIPTLKKQYEEREEFHKKEIEQGKERSRFSNYIDDLYRLKQRIFYKNRSGSCIQDIIIYVKDDKIISVFGSFGATEDCAPENNPR